MTYLLLIALIVAVAKLWQDVGDLKRRLLQLEMAGLAIGSAPIPDIIPAPPARTPAIPDVMAAAATKPAMAARVIRATGQVSREDPPAADRESAARAAPAPVVPVSSPPDEDVQPVSRYVGDLAPAPRPVRTFSFEDIFGRKLPIWAGGVTLAICGFLIVKYSIDAGLLSPWVRVVGGLLFGGGLIAGAEAALRNDSRVRDPRVRQALAGAGIATLYAAVLVAANLYALVSPVVAFGGLTLVTVAAAFLSVRFGPPSAVLGLVGGLAAPALVGTGAPNVPLLAAYLTLAVGGLATLGRAQRWWWLGAAALVGGFGWGAALLFSGALDAVDALSLGGFLLVLGVGLPVLLFAGERGWIVRLLGTLAAAAQLAALVATGGFTMLHWGLFGLLGIAAVWLSRRERALADLPVPALAIALLLMAVWPHAAAREHLALVLGGAMLIFGVPAAWRAWRADGRLSDAGTVAALAAAPLVLGLLHFSLADTTASLLALAGAGAGAAMAVWGWRVAGRREDSRFALLGCTAAVLLAVAAAFGLQPVWVAPAWAGIGACLVILAHRADDRRLERFAWVAGAATLAAFGLDLGSTEALGHAIGQQEQAALPLEALRWTIGCVAALAFARWGRAGHARQIGEVAAVLLGYVALAQVTPIALLPLIPAIGLAALGWSRRSDAAYFTAAALAGAWAAWPLLMWLTGAIGAAFAIPLYVTALPGLADTATRLLAPAVAAAIAFWRYRPTHPAVRQGWIVAIALLAGAAAHIGYKHLFAIATPQQFVALGLAERTVWEAALTLGALALARRLPAIARAIGLAALAHFTWFTVLLHDPLWSAQAVGGWPVVNLLLPAYAIGFGLLWAAGRLVPPLPAIAERARRWAQMLLILLFAASELRQLVHGSLLATGALSQTEDIARSVLAIGIAIGFLQWGIRRRQRDWRIASLVVMLGAVLKVFLLDTSGLDGLLRIAAFAALGFSLIGIGWLYSRYLPDAGVNPPAATA